MQSPSLGRRVGLLQALLGLWPAAWHTAGAGGPGTGFHADAHEPAQPAGWGTSGLPHHFGGLATLGAPSGDSQLQVHRHTPVT